jgi:hypothetical protein
MPVYSAMPVTFSRVASLRAPAIGIGSRKKCIGPQLALTINFIPDEMCDLLIRQFLQKKLRTGLHIRIRQLFITLWKAWICLGLNNQQKCSLLNRF